VFGLVTIKTPLSTKNLSSAKQLETACRLYAADNHGRFPDDLEELVPDIIPDGGLSKLRYMIPGQKDEPTGFTDWLYFGAGFTAENPPPLLLASPHLITRQNDHLRLYIEGHGQGSVNREAVYQQLLSETNRQIRALHESRRSEHPPTMPVE